MEIIQEQKKLFSQFLFTTKIFFIKFLIFEDKYCRNIFASWTLDIPEKFFLTFSLSKPLKE